MPEIDYRTLEQRRAAKAWAHVQAVPKGKRGEYRALVRKATAMVKINGLGQTLAFLLDKAGKSAEDIRKDDKNELNENALLYKQLEEWLVEDDSGANLLISDREGKTLKAEIPWANKEKRTLIERILSNDSTIYRLVSEEALAYLGWLKRFAEALAFSDEKAEGE
jgi:CRISPR-associated protein Cmr5